MRTNFDAAEVFASAPSGGRTKQWLVGLVLAAVPIVYGVVCIRRGHTTLFGRGTNSDLTGDAAFWLALAYIAGGAFLHFRYFWGLSERLSNFSDLGEVISLLFFLLSLLYSFYRIFV